MAQGYTVDGKHIHTFGNVEMTGKRIPVTPPFSNNDESQAGIDGGWDFGIQYEPKIIEVDHYIIEDTKQTRKDLERALAGYLNPRFGSRQIIFDDEPDKMYFGRLSEQFKLDDVVSVYSDFTLNFICYDPFTYSVQEYTEQITTSGTIEHLGTHVSQPILIIDHAGGSASIVNTPEDGIEQTVEFNADTPPGIYTIDMKRKTVKQGSIGADKYIESLEWFELKEGINTITHGIGINDVTVNYRHTWL